MKRIFNTCLLAATGSLLLGSCTKKIDEAYPNPNANVVQPIELLMPNIIQNMAISNTANGTLYGPQNDGQYVGRYVQYWATNTANNQYDLMGQTTTNSTAAAADIGGSHWAMLYYGQGANLNRVIEWGTEQKKWDYVGVAHAIRAWAWLTTTDMHGEIIVRQAFDPDRLVFEYDSQEAVYDEVKRNCRLALEYLSRTGDGVSADNLAQGAAFFSYKGDVEKWKKFTYSVLARVFHRTTNKATYSADSVVKYCDLGINTNADNAYVLFEGTNSVKMSFYGPTRGNMTTLRQTRWVANLMSGANTAIPVADPRAWYMLRENTNGTFRGVRPGKGAPDGLTTNDAPPNPVGGTTNNGNARYIFKDAMPWPVITATEIQFMKAEALYRKGAGTKAAALDAYKKGIELSFDMLTTDYNTSIPAGKEITPSVKSTFLGNAAIVPSLANFNLTHIMLQKYIALFGYGFLETWVDMRRYHYTDHEGASPTQVYADFAPPAPSELFANNNQKYIYRVRPRYNSEFLYNIDALTTIGALALDYHTKEQWFSLP
ncbi:MAG: SusD/RagB family nutrient-binding outer membrane lipoprotein [Chitinophagaceae bacterium]